MWSISPNKSHKVGDKVKIFRREEPLYSPDQIFMVLIGVFMVSILVCLLIWDRPSDSFDIWWIAGSLFINVLLLIFSLWAPFYWRNRRREIDAYWANIRKELEKL